MNHGKIEQFEKPDALIADKAGLFAQLLKSQTEELHEWWIVNELKTFYRQFIPD